MVLIVGGATLAAHWPALSAEALSFDDYQYLVNNPLVTHPSLESARRFLTEVFRPSTVGGYYQPLAMISLMIDDAMGGRPDSLRPFHRTSLALHVANAVLISILLLQLFGSAWAAACAGILFGLHPLTVEPIPWIGERKTLLATFFALASLIAYVRHSRVTRSKAFYAASLFLFILALMSKPTATLLPAAMLLMDIWPLRRFGPGAILEKLPFFLVAGISAVVTYLSQSATFVQTPIDVGPLRIPLVLCHNIIFYLWKIVCPANLSSHYPFPEPMSLSNPAIAAGVIGTIVLLAALVVSWRRTRAPAISWLIFFVLILPTMGVIGFTIVIASDKYVYLPSIGLLILISAALTRIQQPKWIVAVTALIVLAATGEALATRNYYAVWRTSETLYTNMLSHAPRASMLHFGLGFTHEMHGRLTDAESEYRHAIEFDDRAVHARNNLGLLLLDQGLYEGAVAQFRAVIQLTPQAADVHSNLALALAQSGHEREAIGECEAALQIDPGYAQAHNNWGVALTRLGQLEDARQHFQEALKLNSELSEARQNLAAISQKSGRPN